MFWYNGELINSHKITLEITNPGLIYGATLFTTLRVYQQSLDHPLTDWNAHCQRLETGLKALDWHFSDWQRLRQGAQILAQNYPVLRITLFPDGKEWITGRTLPADLSLKQKEGVIGWVANDFLLKRSLAQYKTGNYLTAWLALQKAQAYGAQEAILRDEQGNWLETSTGNLWGYKQGGWYTPSLSEDILSGIRRSRLLKELQKHNISVQERLWTPNFIDDLEIIGYSNSVVEFMPFSQIRREKTVQNLAVNHSALTLLRKLKGLYSHQE